MRTLAFDGRTGAAGDMLLGALLAAGADQSALAPVEETLPVEYRVERVDRAGVTATSVDVLVSNDASDHSHSHEHPPDEESKHSHSPDHDEEHAHNHSDSHSHDHDHAEGAGVTRTYPEVVDIVEEMSLPDEARERALGAFRRLGEAEATIHDTALSETAFHEVGTDDAIADIVGVALLLANLDVERVVTTPVFAGGGEVEMTHGVYPVPAPAVVEIADGADWELRGGPVERELLTPTGAAILAEVAAGVESLPPMRVSESGYGAGTLTLADRPNVVRAVVGDGSGGLVHDEIRVLETNLDDASPELLGDLQRSLAAVGARDVTILPATMKKSRPGHLVKVVVKPEDAAQVARRLAEETGTLGVRETGAGHRWIAERAFETVELAVDGERHEVLVKVARDDAGTVYDVSAEFDDCAAVAEATGLATREVMRRAERQVREN
ncbi:nickel pincer cofactor biosynthesis protein LarC [Halosegnis sp.]|uniref:nickel pincer cofactor biosynthesis protein LarC n=1 Tax=Halosegnis sp. TaxID=2864959 RepID=UPI0035D51836